MIKETHEQWQKLIRKESDINNISWCVAVSGDNSFPNIVCCDVISGSWGDTLGDLAHIVVTVIVVFGCSVNTTNEGTTDCTAQARAILDRAPPPGPANPIDPIGK